MSGEPRVQFYHDSELGKTERFRVEREGTIFVSGEETENPWIIGRAVLDWAKAWAVSEDL